MYSIDEVNSVFIFLLDIPFTFKVKNIKSFYDLSRIYYKDHLGEIQLNEINGTVHGTDMTANREEIDDTFYNKYQQKEDLYVLFSSIVDSFDQHTFDRSILLTEIVNDDNIIIDTYIDLPHPSILYDTRCLTSI